MAKKKATKKVEDNEIPEVPEAPDKTEPVVEAKPKKIKSSGGCTDIEIN